MKLSEILLILGDSQSPQDWMRVNDESGDGGFVMVCRKDVLLCLTVDLVWVADKPFTRLEVKYSSTILSWADLPLASADRVPDVDQLIGHANKLLSGS